MTRVYFVRHAQPEHDWKEDRTRPLTEEGKVDSVIVLEFLKDKKIDSFYCSPYKRSMDKKDRKAITMGCFRNAGRIMIIMKKVENLLPWFRNVTWKP